MNGAQIILTPEERAQRQKAAYQNISQHLNAIAEYFKEPKLTLIVRAPNLADGDLVLTNDSLDDVLASITKMKDREQEKLVALPAEGAA